MKQMKRFLIVASVFMLALSVTVIAPTIAIAGDDEMELPVGGDDGKSGLPGQLGADPDSFGATDASVPIARVGELENNEKSGPWGGFLRSLWDFLSVFRSVGWFQWVR
jgi:hypothetical protein